MTTATVPDETPPQPPDALATLMDVSRAAHANEAAALTFYRRALVIVALAAVLFAGGLLWVGSTLSAVNGRGVCNAAVIHTLDADVHLLIAGNQNPHAYVIPPQCH